MAVANMAWYKHHCCVTISEVLYPGRAMARLGRLLFGGHGSPRPLRVFGCACVRARLKPFKDVADPVSNELVREPLELGPIATRSSYLKKLHAYTEPSCNFLGREPLFGMEVDVN